MDINKIKKLIMLVEKSNISEIEISENKKSIKICRKIYNKSNLDNIYSKKEQKKDIHDDLNINTFLKSDEKNKNIVLIKSPMVGIFYRSPSPKDNPFVEIEQKIKIGDIVCIIEAMKTMNYIKSDYTGIVKSIFLENGNPVEFDEPLIEIKLK
ncbi:accB [Wigglesworthia glossinidia endosymbiont of Glossina brevipalpis]|uniref:Biotin carboxyl carrier protein of acetyl-CoA carboxylase n=1 Tax=Wigglesworthia glossinidia brevipalpis TaxID=36870 RepID=Q8D1V4_WIGBR|nr:accB [Wigglesworthia glossinidia endosymbiont of Glossina brevipalpis]